MARSGASIHAHRPLPRIPTTRTPSIGKPFAGTKRDSMLAGTPSHTTPTPRLRNFTLRAQCAYLTNGIISAATNAGNVSLTCNSLVVSNHTIQSGATLSLSVTSCITDGYYLFNQFGHTFTT